jgi:hypothetical protein
LVVPDAYPGNRSIHILGQGVGGAHHFFIELADTGCSARG